MEDVYLYLAIASFALAAISFVACIVIFFKAGVPDAIRFLQHKPLKSAGNGSLRVVKPRAGASRSGSAAPAVSPGDSRTSPINTGSGAPQQGPADSAQDVPTGRQPSVERVTRKIDDAENPTDLLDEEPTEHPTDFLRDEEDSEMPTGLLVGEDDAEAPTGMLIDEEEAEDPTGLLVEQGGTEDPTGLLGADEAAAASEAAPESSDEDASEIAAGDSGEDADESAAASSGEEGENAAASNEPENEGDAASDDVNDDGGRVAQYGDGDFRFILKQNVVVVHTDEVIGD